MVATNLATKCPIVASVHQTRRTQRSAESMLGELLELARAREPFLTLNMNYNDQPEAVASRD